MPSDESLSPKQMDEADARVYAYEEELREARLAEELRQQNQRRSISVSSLSLPPGVGARAGRLLAAGFAKSGESYVMTLAELRQAQLARDDFSFLLTTGIASLNPPGGLVHSYAVDRDGNLAFSLNADILP